MKKQLLICLTFAASLSAVGQQRNTYFPQGFRKAEVPESMKNFTIQRPLRVQDAGSGIPVANVKTHPVAQPNTMNNVIEDKIGETYYDLQTNNTVSNRLSNNGDGTFSAVWTFSPDALQVPSEFPNRGNGYNYYDGTAWQPIPTMRNTHIRVGFPNIIVCDNAEMTIQHTGEEMSLNWRATRGSGAWTLSYPWGMANDETWPKAVASGDVVHAIWQGTGDDTAPEAGQKGPIYYTRSEDAGVTWTPKTIIPQIDSSSYVGFGGDNYMIDAKGNKVVICYSSVVADVGILISDDGGVTWTKKIVQTHPIPFYDIDSAMTDLDGDNIPDTLNTNAGDAHAIIDNNGKVHVWFSDFRWYSDFTVPGSYNYFPSTDGLFYWNEDMPADGYVLIAATQDYNGNGVLDVPADPTCQFPWGEYRGGLTQMPSAGIDDNGTIYMTYQTINESADTALFKQAHRHVYMMTLPMTGGTYDPNNWTYPYNIVPTIAQGGDGENQEAVFASMARLVDAQYAYVLYQRDLAPGHALADPGCDLTNNFGNISDIIFARVPSATVGITSTPVNDVYVSQNYPNPAVNVTFVQVGLKKRSDIRVDVSDVTGRILYTDVEENRDAGDHSIMIKTENWTSGVYFYSVTAGGQKVTRQMIVQ